MDLETLKDEVQKFFGDKSRTAQETRDGLLEVAELCGDLADTIPDEG